MSARLNSYRHCFGHYVIGIAAALTIGSTPSFAGSVTFLFSGDVSYSSLSPVQIGDHLSGSYTFDPTTPSASSNASTAFYPAASHIGYSVGNYYGSANGGGISTSLAADSGHAYVLQASSPSYILSPSTNGFDPIRVVLQLIDPTKTALTNDALLAGAPDLAKFASASFGLTFFNRAVAALQGISATITSLTAVTDAVHVGSVYSTVQNNLQSYLSFYNAGSTVGTVTLSVSDYSTGQNMGTWTSPSIPAGAVADYSVGTIENGLFGQAQTKPALYTVAVYSNMSGTFQHLLLNSTIGVLTNNSVCDVGVTAPTTTLAGVVSSPSGYSGMITINNTGPSATAVTLKISDARNGGYLGTYISPTVPASGQLNISVATIEQGAGIAPSPGMYKYVVAVASPIAGYLQYQINTGNGEIVTDMTTACRLNRSQAH